MLNNGIHNVHQSQRQNNCHCVLYPVEFAKIMSPKDERIGFRVSSEVKNALAQIAKKEGRSLAQICELFLKGAVRSYNRQGSKYVHLLLESKQARDL